MYKTSYTHLVDVTKNTSSRENEYLRCEKVLNKFDNISQNFASL